MFDFEVIVNGQCVCWENLQPEVIDELLATIDAALKHAKDTND